MEVQSGDGWVWVEDVREDAEGEVAPCRVAAEGDVGGGRVSFVEEVGQQGDGFAELRWVGCVRRQRVA